MSEPKGFYPSGLQRDDAGAVRWFSRRMLTKLRANDHKGGWQNLDRRWLLHRLRQEIAELDRALRRNDPHAIIHESSDVANFAMMIADNTRR